MDTRGDPETLFRENSRSFSLAARFFQPSDQRAVARLYRFCRYLDDLADDTLEGDIPALDLAYSRLNQTVAVPHETIEADFLALARERSIPIEPALELMRALRGDCGRRSIQTGAELIRFAYGVAGTVGQMLRHVIDARDDRAEAFAIDLGVALQLSNVMRDIAEDAQRGRFYLPAEWVKPVVIQRALEREEEAMRQVLNAVRRTHLLAEKYYASATRGFIYIPARNRRVIFLATEFYREIGNKVLRSGMKDPRKRTVVSFVEKLGLVIRAVRGYRQSNQTHWLRHPAPCHDHTLHSAFKEMTAGKIPE